MFQAFAVFAIAASVIFVTTNQQVNAAGGFTRYFAPYLSADSATANGSSPITLRVLVTSTSGESPAAPEGGVPVSATATGGANISPASGTTDGSGNISFTVTSSTVTSSTISIISAAGPGPDSVVLSQTVNFVTAPPPAPVVTPPPTASARASTPAAATPAAAASTPAAAATPAAPVVSEVVFGEQKIDPAQPSKLPELPDTKPFKLAGKTTPNTELTVYVFSEPKLFKTRSDANGNWSVTVAGLPTGQHHAELEAVDAAGKALPRTQLGAFKVVASASKKQAAQAVKAGDAAGGSTTWFVVGAALLAVVVTGGGVTALVLHKRQARTNTML